MLLVNSSQKILNLSGVIIKNIINDSDTTTYEIEMIRKPHDCPCCHHTTQTIHDYRMQKIKDIPAFASFEKEDMFVQLVASVFMKI